MNDRTKKFEIPKQVITLNKAVEELAKMEFRDLAEVEKTIFKIRLDLGKVNFELCDLINEP